ncbi:MAG: SAF domain-containing protein [Desertimonas sp.]
MATGRVGEPTHRNPVWLLGGVLLVLASAIGGMLLFQAGDERVEALISAHDLAPGETVGRDDFRIRRVSIDGVDIVAPGDVDVLVGQRAVGPIPSGALVHPGMFSAADPIGPDEMDVGAALEPGAFPRSDLTLGAAVELLVTDVAAGGLAPAVAVPATESVPSSTVVPAADPSAGGEAAAAAGAAMSIGRGTIVGVEERATGELLVTVRVPRAIGLSASQAAADGRLRLVLVSGVGEG